MQQLAKMFGLLFMLASTQLSFAQLSFSHDVGVGIYVAENGANSPAIVYSPRLNVLEIQDHMTISVGTHLGAWLAFNSREGGDGSFAFDLPIMASINFGQYAQPEAEDLNIGGFVGVGYGISRLGSESTFTTDYNEANGLVFDGGLRFILRGIPLGIRGSYQLNSRTSDSNEDFGNVYSLGAFMTLR